MSTICLICARGGSKGVPRKNIRPLGGIPLIAHSIRRALASDLFASVVVSTEDEAIAEAARGEGALVPFMRPAELATDECGKVGAMLHAVETLRAQGHVFDVVLDRDPTVPFLNADDMKGCLELLRQRGDCDVVAGVSPVHVNPYFHLVESNEEGYLRISKGAQDDMRSNFLRRQDCPEVWTLHGLIGLKVDAFLKRRTVYSPHTLPFRTPEHRSIMIDHELEFRFAEFLVAQGEATIPLPAKDHEL